MDQEHRRCLPATRGRQSNGPLHAAHKRNWHRIESKSSKNLQKQERTRRSRWVARFPYAPARYRTTLNSRTPTGAGQRPRRRGKIRAAAGRASTKKSAYSTLRPPYALPRSTSPRAPFHLSRTSPHSSRPRPSPLTPRASRRQALLRWPGGQGTPSCCRRRRGQRAAPARRSSTTRGTHPPAVPPSILPRARTEGASGK